MAIRNCNFLVPIMFSALLSACATPPQVADIKIPKPSMESSVADAYAAQKAGQTEQALTLLKGAANQYPADKTPWLRIAQIKFDNANYGEAIINALEALQRDPTDKIANSIVTVSGLRLSTKALSDLRTQNALSGTVKSEAQDLAKLLRESLGETVLVPPAVKPPVAHASARSHAAKSANAAAAAANAETDSGRSNPFGGLK